MRKLKVSTFVTLDGVMQAPGGPDEDRRRVRVAGQRPGTRKPVRDPVDAAAAA